MHIIKRREFIILPLGAAMMLPTAARALDIFPSRPIRLIVPYPPAGGTDIVGRVLGEKVSASLGQPIVVDNRGGAGGVLGTEIVAKAAPDGYTLLLVPTSHVINPSIYAKLPYDTAKDFAPITMVASVPILMAVNPRVPAETVRGFVEAAKANPKAIGNYGSAGVGTVFHLIWSVVQSTVRLVVATCALSRGWTDSHRTAGRRGSARFRNDVVAAAPCPCRHVARSGDHQC
jgi:tripartite-type tricarboxylate transporter receptor subunit TctC